MIDPDKIDSPALHMVHDPPDGAKRFMQRPTGYVVPICRADVILEYDELTGTLQGKLVRGPQEENFEH